MDSDHHNPDRLLSEPPQGLANQQDRDEKMSQGTAPVNEDVAATNDNNASSAVVPSQSPNDPYAEQVQCVVNSEVSCRASSHELFQTDSQLDWSSNVAEST
jgi:hypothetical protein